MDWLTSSICFYNSQDTCFLLTHFKVKDMCDTFIICRKVTFPGISVATLSVDPSFPETNSSIACTHLAWKGTPPIDITHFLPKAGHMIFYRLGKISKIHCPINQFFANKAFENEVSPWTLAILCHTRTA